MKKTYQIIYGALFFLIILTPLLLMPLSPAQNTENRIPAPAPVLISEGAFNPDAPVEFEAYFKDRYAGRTLMIDAYSRMINGIFGISANDRVIAGKDGWLFFSETIGDYDGTAALDTPDMQELIGYIYDIKQTAEARGQVFILLIAPNKNTIYGEYMPYAYKRTAAPTNFENILAETKLGCIDLRPVLAQASLDYGLPVYFKTDSHWNGIGARAAARLIMQRIADETGVKPGAPYDAILSPADITQTNFTTGSVTGDLAKMLYPMRPPADMDYIFPDTQQNYRTAGRYRSPDDMHITTVSDGAPLKIAMYRDSFAVALMPYLSNAYSNVYYTRQTPVPINREEFADADVVIFQIVERRLPDPVKQS